MIHTLSRYVRSAKLLVCVLFCWCKTKSTFIHCFRLDTKSGKQTGTFTHQDKVRQKEN